MKNIKIICLFNLVITVLISCSDKESRYVDLNTGKGINVMEDSTTGYRVNADTREPVIVYYDAQTKDTIYGKTGEVINNKVMKTADGKYYYEPPTPVESKIKVKTQDEIDRELLKNGDYKKKVEKDGDIKIKHGDTKIKIDAETGEKKVKN